MRRIKQDEEYFGEINSDNLVIAEVLDTYTWSALLKTSNIFVSANGDSLFTDALDKVIANLKRQELITEDEVSQFANESYCVFYSAF